MTECVCVCELGPTVATVIKSVRRCHLSPVAVSSSISSSSMRTEWSLALVWCMVGVLLALERPVHASCVGSCRNGGKLYLPNNLFGYCMCRCRGGYTGPRCEYTQRKRSFLSSSSSSSLGPSQRGFILKRLAARAKGMTDNHNAW